MQLIKLFYLFLGFVCVGLGLLGIPLPGLPTTPFCYLLSSFLQKDQIVYTTGLSEPLFIKST